MILFIDLGSRFDPTTYGERRFAFYDTMSARFLEDRTGAQSWHDWQEFADEYDGTDLEPLRALCPSWVHQHAVPPATEG